ncbi:MAG: hypothetical protein IPN80_04065 [Flavobacterium sp.]|nr:hypothetical protein [Flavobacterium sp.]
MQKFYDISKKEKRLKSIYQSDGKPFKQFHKSTIPPLNKSTILQINDLTIQQINE